MLERYGIISVTFWRDRYIYWSVVWRKTLPYWNRTSKSRYIKIPRIGLFWPKEYDKLCVTQSYYGKISSFRVNYEQRLSQIATVDDLEIRFRVSSSSLEDKYGINLLRRAGKKIQNSYRSNIINKQKYGERIWVSVIKLSDHP